MKQNGNDSRKGNYYLGLDVGTESCGWAVTDFDYNLSKFKGQHMWGARLFSEASTAAERRNVRSARRRLQRRRQRLDLLEMLFNNEIEKVDENFFRRLQDSSLHLEDKRDTTCKYSLFNDPDFTDKDYLKKYPTIYHLRNALISENDIDDPRLLYLAIYHMLKHRGHFLYETSDNENGKSFNESYDDLVLYLENNNIHFAPANIEAFQNELKQGNETITAKKKKLKEFYGKIEKSSEVDEEDKPIVDLATFIELLAGAKVKLDKLFNDETLKDAEEKSVSLADDIDAKYDTYA